MCAATAVAESGAVPIALERAPMIGGCAAFSGGYIWTLEGLEALLAEDPGEFQRHGHPVVAGYHEISEWLAGFAAAPRG
jgi:hypothetical protein